MSTEEQQLRSLFDHAVAAVAPRRVLPPHLPEPPPGRAVILAVGKGATAMAEAVAENWRGPLSGLAVTRYGHTALPASRRGVFEIIEAGHPVPDENSVTAALRALDLARGLDRDDLALVLISGGGSALWCLPIEQLGLQEKRRITAELMLAGASIDELNAVRTSLSRIKGGKLAQAAFPARVVTLIVSDVVGDDPAVIASGPTVWRQQSFAAVEDILARYQVDLPATVRKALRRQLPAAAEPADARSFARIVATAADALAAAGREARAAGFAVRMLGCGIEGDARDAARAHAAIALETARDVAGGGQPTVMLSGGEVTAAVRDRSGIGGPNTEFVLALALELQALGQEGAREIYALACDTDGYDGAGENAGAVMRPDTLQRARELGLDPVQALESSDSARFFEALGDLVVTGPTQTNVSDFRAILVRG